MNTTWRVTKVTETEAATTAELRRVTWFKPNPEWVGMMAEYDALVEEHGQREADQITAERQDAGVWVEQFLDAEPGEPGAEFIDADDTMTLNISEDGLDLHAGDDVAIEVRVVTPVEA